MKRFLSIIKDKKNILNILRILLGISLIMAACGKILPVGAYYKCGYIPLELFLSQIIKYHFPLPKILIEISTIPLITFELLIGLLLVFNTRVKFALILLQILMFFMIPITLWGTFMGVSDCGCYGNLVKRPPWVATIEDFLILVLCFLLYPRYKENKKTNIKIDILILFICLSCAIYTFWQLLQIWKLNAG